MISVCFRLDDPSARSDHKLEARIFECFSRHSIPLCAAVLPFAGAGVGKSIPVSPKNASHLFDAAKAGIIEISQHGHSHIERGADERGRRSEFAGLEMTEQRRLIEEGRDHLACVFSQPIAGFVPPWNTYDVSTTLALEECGFEYLSAGWDIHRFGRLPLVPATCTLRGVRNVLERSSSFSALEPVIVVVFHCDDFQEYHRSPHAGEDGPFTSMDELDALLCWINSQPGIRAEALGEIARNACNGSLQSNRELALPHRIKGLLPPMLVRSRGAWRCVPDIFVGALRDRYNGASLIAFTMLIQPASFCLQ